MSQQSFHFKNGYILTLGSIIFPEAPLDISIHYPSQITKQAILYDKNTVIIGNPNVTEYKINVKIPNFDYFDVSLVPEPKQQNSIVSQLSNFNFSIGTKLKSVFDYTHPALFYLKVLETFKLAGTPIFFCLQRTKPNKIILDSSYDTVVVDEVTISETPDIGFDRKISLQVVKYMGLKNQRFIINDRNITNTQPKTFLQSLFNNNSNFARDGFVSDINYNSNLKTFSTNGIVSSQADRTNIIDTLKSSGVDFTTIPQDGRVKKFINSPYTRCPPSYVPKSKAESLILQHKNMNPFKKHIPGS